MMESEPPESNAAGYKERFLHRVKLHSNIDHVTRVAQRIHALLRAGETEELREYLSRYYPADLADVIPRLPEADQHTLFKLLGTEEAAEMLDEVDDRTEAMLVRAEDPARIAAILDELPADEGADIAGALRDNQVEHVLSLTETDKAASIRALLLYPPETAGGIMSTDFVAVPEGATQAEALRCFRESPGADHLFYIYVVGENGDLKGMIDLRRLLLAEPETPVREFMTEGMASVPPEMDQEQVAQIFARYDLMALPVVEQESRRLMGVVTADDIIDVIQEEDTEDALRSVGSDAHELEQRPPAQIALMRLPWIMATMFIELIAGFVIKGFNGTLAHFLLLASFMPIISAISGNTGLQSATIIVRGLSTGHIQISEWRHALGRQVVTTLILGASCGIVLGLIGAAWSGKWTFGLVVALGMFMSVNIAGAVGTVVPMLSKRLGYDPALTAGPFETAFQDVVGISIFLSLATLLLNWIK
jgi:magnesium transporter